MGATNTMDSSNIKLIAVDLDGTLLNSSNQVSNASIGTLRKLYQQGIEIVLASGRPYESIVPIAKKIGITGPIISANGALIMSGNKEILSECLQLPISLDIIAYGLEKSYAMSVYYKGGITTNSKMLVGMHRSLEGLRANFSTDLATKKPIYKMIYADNPARISEAYYELKERFGQKMYLTQSDDIFLDFMNINVSKGNALRLIMNQMDINSDQVITFGNSYNDISMFKNSKISVAMQNASEVVKSEASVVTLSNDSDGVARFLESYFE